MKTYGVQEINSSTLDVDTGFSASGQHHLPALLRTVSIGQAALWAPELDQTLWSRDK
jgi:hypothetical protein